VLFYLSLPLLSFGPGFLGPISRDWGYLLSLSISYLMGTLSVPPDTPFFRWCPPFSCVFPMLFSFFFDRAVDLPPPPSISNILISPSHCFFFSDMFPLVSISGVLTDLPKPPNTTGHNRCCGDPDYGCPASVNPFSFLASSPAWGAWSVLLFCPVNHNFFSPPSADLIRPS